MDSSYVVEGRIELFDRDDGWYFVPIPGWISAELVNAADRGLIAISAAIDGFSWDTSLMPMGDGTHFIPLNASVRRANDLDRGDPVTVEFSVRVRKSRS